MIQMHHQKTLSVDSKRSMKCRSNEGANAAPEDIKTRFLQITVQGHNDVHWIIPDRSHELFILV